jgi:hypothetical protein
LQGNVNLGATTFYTGLAWGGVSLNPYIPKEEKMGWVYKLTVKGPEGISEILEQAAVQYSSQYDDPQVREQVYESIKSGDPFVNPELFNLGNPLYQEIQDQAFRHYAGSLSPDVVPEGRKGFGDNYAQLGRNIFNCSLDEKMCSI